MAPALRHDLRFFRLSSRGFLLLDPASGARYRLGAEERDLLRLMDGRRDLETIRDEYERRSGAKLRKRALRDFLNQLRAFGLVLSSGTDSLRPPVASASDLPLPAPPLPLGSNDPGARLNGAFDLLALLFGWAFSPVFQLVTLAIVGVAGVTLARDFDRFTGELTLLLSTASPWLVVPAMLAEFALVLSLPRELSLGTACRRFGGRVRRFDLHVLAAALPVFHCDIGDSVARMGSRARITVLSADLYAHCAIGSLAVLGWAMAPPQSILGMACVLLIPPWMIGAMVQLVPFTRRAGYRLLCHWLGQPNLHDRAVAEARAWLRWQGSPEPLRRRERFWLRVYGLAQGLWSWSIRALVVGLGFWWLAARHGGSGVVFGLALLAVAYRKALCSTVREAVHSRWWSRWGRSIHRTPLSSPVREAVRVRWWIRHGGERWLRWSVRLVLFVSLVGLGFLPYDREVGGECRVIASAEYGIRAQIAAEIVRVHVAYGDEMERGDIIAELSERDVSASIAQLEADLAEDEAELALLRVGPRPEEIAVARQQVEIWRLRVAKEEVDLARQRKLAREGVISSEDLEQVELSHDSTRQLYLSAQQNYHRLEDGTRDEALLAAEARVASTRARLAHARSQRELLTLRSPTSGKVVTSNLKQREGQVAQVGDLIAVIQDASSVRVEIAASEDAAALVETGMPVDIRLKGLDGRLITGQVEHVASATVSEEAFWTESVRTDREALFERGAGIVEKRYLVRVLVALDDSQSSLVAGMTGYARIWVGEDVLGLALLRPIVRFVRTEVWSWLP